MQFRNWRIYGSLEKNCILSHWGLCSISCPLRSEHQACASVCLLTVIAFPAQLLFYVLSPPRQFSALC